MLFNLQPLLDTMPLGLFEKSAEGPQRWHVRGRSTPMLSRADSLQGHSSGAVLLYTGGRNGYRHRPGRIVAEASVIPCGMDKNSLRRR